MFVAITLHDILSPVIHYLKSVCPRDYESFCSATPTPNRHTYNYPPWFTALIGARLKVNDIRKTQVLDEK